MFGARKRKIQELERKLEGITSQISALRGELKSYRKIALDLTDLIKKNNK